MSTIDRDENKEVKEDKEEEVKTRRVPYERIMGLLAERRQRARFGEDQPGLTEARQPTQPPSGPGGASYSHGGVRSNLYGEGELAYWVFEPTDPTPPSAPIVIFLHGWGGGSPSRQGAWVDHLVKRGKVVIFPVYQGSLMPWSKPWERTPATGMLGNVVAAVKEAIKRLQTKDHVRPELERCAIVGSSLGGALTAQIAAVSAHYGLPMPKAIMPLVPSRGLWARRPLPPVDLHGIPSTVLMVVVACEDDKNAGDHEGKVIFADTLQIPHESKNLLVMVSDYHGTPPLVANHHSPAASNVAYGLGEQNLTPPNAIHYYGYWKLFDGLTDAAFYDRNREYALGNTPEQRFMGTWSDGVPVKELKVITHPETMDMGNWVRGKSWRRRNR